ncbi:Na+/H+ antiporter NhaC family protein [Otariodibacter oris]|uniref:Transporter (NhaC family) n=1 Tax=Otariodibacter oris TaxID=1032623 RepID=A0A420XJ46_9PAST|nr:Na+/H+ antiporter NhaC family protein [Otariodibacter oris]QGM80565.1 Na+/H+ antiporter [Otariodibacter oris]RKR77279.1 transporter (NhaC family) [Otariodibacter oris]
MNLIDYSTSAWSVVPPLLALLLAIFTRRVIISLSIGIIAGALMLNNGNPIDAIIHLKNNILSLVYGEDGLNSNNINIILFLILLGILTALLSISGSNQAFASWAQNHIKGRRGAKLMAASLVFFTFIDDYFHSLAVGAIARPVTDKFQISRAKLAYILDSTAAPMCVLMPISSWGAYIITLVAGLLATYSITEYSPLGAFMTMSAMNFYAIFSIIMVFIVSYYTLDIGSMVRFEKEALADDKFKHSNMDSNTEGKVRNLILPIVVLIVGTVTMMMITGNQALAESGKPFDILGAFENTTVGISLVVGGISSLIIASLLIMFDKKINIKEYTSSYLIGAKSMSGAILILFFAWTINGIVGDMQTGKYLSTLVADTINPAFLPAILFVLGSFMAFSTGTSWGTFGIMLPIAAAMAANADPSLLLPSLSAVMAGAVCGDHCSPISDTTILSSTGAQCNHIDHVTSQLPYALVVAVATMIGYLILGFTKSALLSFIGTAILLAIFIIIFKSKQK